MNSHSTVDLHFNLLLNQDKKPAKTYTTKNKAGKSSKRKSTALACKPKATSYGTNFMSASRKISVRKKQAPSPSLKLSFASQMAPKPK